MHKPGVVRDAIVEHLKGLKGDASTEEIRTAIKTKIGEVSPSSVRSYLRLNTPGKFERTAHGRYKLSKASK